MTTKILLFEKGASTVDSLGPTLDEEGYTVLLAHEEEKAIEWASSGKPDLLILDISALALDSPRIWESLQQEIEMLPCLLIVAEGEEVEAEVEVDAWLAKPLIPEQLSSYIEELLQLWGEKFLRVGNLTLNLETRRLFRGNRVYKLSPKQFDLLKTFMRRPGQVLSPKFLMKEVWETDYLGDVGTLYVHIRWLREKIEEDPGSPVYLRTVRRKGYRLNAPEEALGEET